MNLRLNLMKWACVVLALAAVACDDDKKKTLPGGETTEGERTRTFFSNDYASGWKYFSFKKGDFIETPAKPNESLDWDVAFNRYYVKTNSGTSGKGKGGCIDSDPMPGAFEVLKKIKADGLIPMVVTGSGQLSLLIQF